MIAHRRMMLSLGAIGLLAFATSTSTAQTASAPPAKNLVIFAAASLKTALDDVAANWAKQTGQAFPKISYAASNTLARQIEQGAPADLFFSADLEWMDFVAARNLIRPQTRVNLLGNKLVIVGPRDSKAEITLVAGVDLAKALGKERLAMGHVDAVPAGKYGKAALESLGAWDGVKGRIAQADNVRAALLYVSRGEAGFGLVYATDAAADPAVKIIATFPENTHPPILYPVAAVRQSTNPLTTDFLAHLVSERAQALFVKHGFQVLNKPAQGS